MKISRFSSIRLSSWWICENLWKFCLRILKPTKMLPQVKRKLIGWTLPMILIQEEWISWLLKLNTLSNFCHFGVYNIFAFHIWLQSANTLQNNVSNVDLILFYGSKTYIYIYIVKLQYNKDIWKWTQQQWIQFWAFCLHLWITSTCAPWLKPPH